MLAEGVDADMVMAMSSYRPRARAQTACSCRDEDEFDIGESDGGRRAIPGADDGEDAFRSAYAQWTAGLCASLDGALTLVHGGEGL